MARSETYDTRRYECCAPFHGEVGEEFTRRFKPEFEGALHGYVDAYASLYEHVVQMDDPGSAANPALPGAPGNAMRATYSQRLKKSFGLIRRHVEDPTLRDLIDAQALGNGPEAWILINAQCTRQQTYLNLSDQDKEWTNTTITEVGFNDRTVESFHALLQRINRERPAAQAKTNIQVWQKLLEGIGSVGNTELKTMVRNEMQRPSLIHGIASPLAGQPNVPEYILHFAERWRVLIHDGTIKQIPARKRSPPTGNRVDAMMASITLEDETHQAHLATNQKQPADQTERVCWNCRGFGHTKVDSAGKIICPSPVKPRPIGECIASLEAMRRREAGRLGKRRMILRRPKPQARLATDTDASEEMEVIIADNGEIYSETGMLIGTMSDAADPSNPEQQALRVVDSIAETAPPDRDGADKATSDHYSPILTLDTEDYDYFFPLPTHLATANAATWSSQASDVDDDIPVLAGKPREARRPVRRTLLLAGGTVALLAAGIAPSRSLQRSLIVLGLLGMTAARSNPLTRVTISPAMLVDFNEPAVAGKNSRTAAAIDTGASMHVSGRRDLFPDDQITNKSPSVKVEVANDAQCKVEFTGRMKLPVKYRQSIAASKSITGYLMLDNALYVPELKDNTLLSPRAMFNDQSIRTYFNDDRYVRMPDGKVIDMLETPTLYLIPFAAASQHARALKAAQTTADQLHERCMHFSLDRIRRSADCLTNAKIQDVMQTSECEACIRASSRRHDAIPRSTTPFTRPGDCICSDTCDMGEYSTPFGFRYFVSFLDMATTYIWVYFLRTHQHVEMRATYTQFLADATPYLHNGTVKIWYMDNGTEFNVSAGVGRDKPGFFANNTDTWLAEYFTRRRFIVPWNPQQNPAESTNRILLRPVRAALSRAGAPTRLFPFAVHQAAIVHNALATLSRTAIHAHAATATKLVSTIEAPTSATNPAKPLSPYQMLRHKRFDLELLHPLFCSCDCLIRNPADIANRPKAAPKTTPAIHLGLDNRRAGYFVYLKEFERFTTSAFKDTYFSTETQYPDNIGSIIRGEIRQTEQAARLPTEQEQIHERPLPENADLRIADPPTDRADRVNLPDLPSSRTRGRTRAAHAMLCESNAVPNGMTVVACQGETALAIRSDVWRPIVCPTTTAEAMQQDKDGWLEAYRLDFVAKLENGAFEFVKRRPNMTVHRCKWAHKLVWNDDDTLKEKRARLVGCGYSQVQGRDYTSSYSSTPKASTVRVFEAAIACFNLEEEHCDVVKAFTQNEVTDVELYTHQPPSLPVTMDEDGKPLIIKVVKALEGFKQSGHLHQINHTKTFTDNDIVKFSITESEPTLLSHVDGEDRIMALIWTDDVHFAYSVSAASKYEKFLREVYGKRWNFKRKGPVRRFVGIDITRNRSQGQITLSMSSYITGVHNRFVQPGYVPRSSPYKSAEHMKSVTTAANETERDAMADRPYLAAVASCIWVYSMMRADISYTLNCLCNVMHDPSEAAWNVLLDLISYLMYTRDVSITYHAKPECWRLPPEVEPQIELVKGMHGLHCWVDASWKNPSVAGFVVMLAGGPIDWSTKSIKVVCHSSAEAEVSAGCLAAKSLMYIRELASSTGFKLKGAIILLSDSEAAIAIGNNLGTTKRTAHFVRWQHYLRWSVRHNYIKMTFTKGKRQLADSLTKAVDITSLRNFRKALYNM